MSALVVEINPMAAAGLAALLNTLWYAGAVVGLTWAILRYAPRVNAATRCWIWTGVLGFLLILPFLPGLVAQARAALGARRETPASVAPRAAVPAAPARVTELEPVTLTVSSAPGSNPWPLWLLAAWMIAAGWQLVRLARGVVWVRRRKQRAKTAPKANTEILRSGQDDRLAFSPGLLSPCLRRPAAKAVGVCGALRHD